MNFSSLVLVDSSVWIDFFRNGNTTLEKLLEENLVCTNELILTELLPYFGKKHQNTIIEGLLSIENIPLHIDWDGIRRYQLINLQNGINKVGIPELIILQQVLEYKLELFTLDKNFYRMKTFFDIRLLKEVSI